jgi:hypothetical protein
MLDVPYTVTKIYTEFPLVFFGGKITHTEQFSGFTTWELDFKAFFRHRIACPYFDAKIERLKPRKWY